MDDERYLSWLIKFIDEDDHKWKRYSMLLHHLDQITFSYTIELDANRVIDALALRQRYSQILPDISPSVLEVMIALAVRCEETIMDNPDRGNRTGKWFWYMIYSLRLYYMTNERYDYNYVNDTIDDFLKRNYSRDGRGGLFYIPDIQSKTDLRKVEIWYQAMWYLDTVE